MALQACRECGREVSTEAPACPHCGVPDPVLKYRMPDVPYGTAIVCRECKAPIPRGSTTCPSCGRVLGTPIRPGADRTGSAGNVVAGIASFVVPGLGQVVQGRVGRGAMYFIGAVLLWAAFLGWVMHIVAAVDAAKWDGVK